MIPFLLLIPLTVADPCGSMEPVFRPPVIAQQYYLECREKLPKPAAPEVAEDDSQDREAVLKIEPTEGDHE